MAKHFNEHFFDAEGKNPEQLKEMWYILGISVSQYSSYLRPYRGQNVQYTDRWSIFNTGSGALNT